VVHLAAQNISRTVKVSLEFLAGYALPMDHSFVWLAERNLKKSSPLQSPGASLPGISGIAEWVCFARLISESLMAASSSRASSSGFFERAVRS
jgi:hypothetical protein